MREWVISFYLERLNMPTIEQPNLLVFNKDAGQILLNSVDITENVIHVMIEWFVHTEAAITVFNQRTQQQKLIACIDLSDAEVAINPVTIH